MIEVSFDPEAGTLYWYFTEIIAGTTAAEGECPGTLLLDADGLVIGIELEFDESIARQDLALALQHPQVRYDEASYTLTVLLVDEEPASVQPLDEGVLLDFDRADQLQGCELLAAKTFGLDKRLERLAPFLVEVDDEEAEETDEADEEEDDEEAEEADEPEGDEGDSDNEPDLQPARPADAGRSQRPSAQVPEGFRAGFVALIGRPNVGKSTILNAILGQKVAIVSPKPQTTRMPIRGMLNRPDAQVIFVDTPGIHDPRTKLGTFMVDQARRAIPDADVICFVVDISTPPNRMDRKIAALTKNSRAPRLLVLNKVDRPPRHNYLDEYRALGPWDMEVATSAVRREGVAALVDELVRRLPPGPPLYPTDQVTDQSTREFTAELVREQVLRLTEQEVPHSVAVEVEEWEQREGALYIRMTIYVEKDSQKGILIGAQGAMLKEIGSRARKGIERALDGTVYLDLWVKTRSNWRDDPSSLHWLGYSRSKKS
ncbi:MAG TPA: GTPase Era [Roseiflexaceae bacterium]|nr:GTPase Era [Roseiflexaceae bacterium]